MKRRHISGSLALPASCTLIHTSLPSAIAVSAAAAAAVGALRGGRSV